MLICFEYLKHTKYKAYDWRKKFLNRSKIFLLSSKSLLFKCQISTKNNELSRLSCQFVSVSVQKVSFISILYHNTCDWVYVYFLQVFRNFTILTVTERNQLWQMGAMGGFKPLYLPKAVVFRVRKWIFSTRCWIIQHIILLNLHLQWGESRFSTREGKDMDNKKG